LLAWFTFQPKQPLNAADDWYIAIFKNDVKTRDLLNEVTNRKEFKHFG
jgi:hypothetical protein